MSAEDLITETKNLGKFGEPDLDEIIRRIRKRATSEDMLRWGTTILYNLLSMGKNAHTILTIMGLKEYDYE